MCNIEEIKEIPIIKVNVKKDTAELIKTLNLTYKKYEDSVTIMYNDYKVCNYSNEDLINIKQKKINKDIIKKIKLINENINNFRETLLDMGYIQFELSEYEPGHYKDYLFTNNDSTLSNTFRFHQNYGYFNLEKTLESQNLTKSTLDKITKHYNEIKKKQKYDDLVVGVLSTWE